MKNIRRKEIKYLLTAQQLDLIMQRFQPFLCEDDFFHQRIHSVYFDNDFNEIINQSLEKPVYKEKLRFRAYEWESGFNPCAYLELKKKYKGIVYKRRIKIGLNQANQICCGKEVFDGSVSQIGREIDFYINHHACRPKIYISYDRRSYRGKLDDTLRVTFDTDILTRKNSLALECDLIDILFFGQGNYIMEIKANGAFPLWLTKILTQVRCYPASYSKYGRIYQSGILSNELHELTQRGN